MNIFYCHGFASAFNPVKPKIQCLSELGPVHGINFDFTQPAETLVERCIAALLEHDIDLLVGTSMGGWLANVAGSRAGLPFVAINPAIEPSRTLMRHVGKGVDHQGRPYDLEASAVLSYSPFRLEGCGLILLDAGDEVLDSAQTTSLCKPRFEVVSFPGGSHRFDHMEASLPVIDAFFHRASLVYGLDDD
ncbi:YqiA/YcfP family alpha/beta fold hydrolase [Allohahella sp. A8]|uniref:YqiA/YcfP family alpha/beta fold hydrolase n=1 Tax=Allohahella sp. A8 TaxID=3141461 RepID=UPI003A80024C